MDPETKAKLNHELRRLDYILLQFSREAKFKRRWDPEDRRFFRGYDALVETHQALEDLIDPSHRTVREAMDRLINS